jgi:tetratricopeptide (TPR) repeat protein
MVLSRPGVTKRFLLLLVLVVISVLLASTGAAADPTFKHSPEAGEEVCDVQADFSLGTEDYPTAIRLHKQVIGRDPKNALAHYHLGFAYGMMGRHQEEIDEYQRAVELGLTDWTLFLNLGLARFEQGNFKTAIDALKVAVLQAPERPEPHYNLALAYERLAMLNEAEREALSALALDPRDPDIRNIVALVSAERGDYQCAHEEWAALLADNPDYEPARTNLAILDQTAAGRSKDSAAKFASADVNRVPTKSTLSVGRTDSTQLHRVDRALIFQSEGVSQLRASPDGTEGGDN